MTYFKSWRRKLGVVTLVLACVFAAGWIRSMNRIDLVIFSCRGHRLNFVTGCGAVQVVGGWLCTHAIAFNADNPTKIVSETLTFSKAILSDKSVNVKYQKWIAPEMIIRTTLDGSDSKEITTIPYWSIVIPLTMLSAYLLLRRPRNAAKVPA